MWSGELNLNSILIIFGWLVGGLVVIVGMRTEVRALTKEISGLRTVISDMNNRVDKHGSELAYLRGRSDERDEREDRNMSAGFPRR